MAAGKIKGIITAVAVLTAICAAPQTSSQHCPHHEAGCQAVSQCPSPAVNRTAAKKQFKFKVKEVKEKPDDDLIRVGGDLIGRPHTSARIDSVTLTTDDARIKANDIDGVDFERYFQWEDEGIIPVEIDFPGYQKAKKMLENGNCIFLFHTVNGEVGVPLKRD